MHTDSTFPQTVLSADEGAAAAAAPAADAGVEEQQMPAAAGGKGGDEGEASPPLMTPEQVEEFFKSTMVRLTSPEEREDIKSKAREQIFEMLLVGAFLADSWLGSRASKHFRDVSLAKESCR